MKVVGKRSYEMQKDGSTYTGMVLHCVYPAAAPAVGELTQTLSVGSMKPGYATACNVPIGAEVTPVYNRFGKVEDVVVAEGNSK